MPKVSPSGWAGTVFFAVIILTLPALANGQWLKIVSSTACFIIAASGVAFMYARFGKRIALGATRAVGQPHLSGPV